MVTPPVITSIAIGQFSNYHRKVWERHAAPSALYTTLSRIVHLAHGISLTMLPLIVGKNTVARKGMTRSRKKFPLVTPPVYNHINRYRIGQFSNYHRNVWGRHTGPSALCTTLSRIVHLAHVISLAMLPLIVGKNTVARKGMSRSRKKIPLFLAKSSREIWKFSNCHHSDEQL